MAFEEGLQACTAREESVPQLCSSLNTTVIEPRTADKSHHVIAFFVVVSTRCASAGSGREEEEEEMEIGCTACFPESMPSMESPICAAYESRGIAEPMADAIFLVGVGVEVEMLRLRWRRLRSSKTNENTGLRHVTAT